jgi:putative resolvase
MDVSVTTLRQWEAEGRLVPERTAGRQRRYDLAKLKPEMFLAPPLERKTIAYARVSSHAKRTTWSVRNKFWSSTAHGRVGRLK